MSDPIHLVPEGVRATPVREARGFDEFFAEERIRLFQALCLVTHNRSEAEELTQDAFLRVLERWDRVGTMDDPTGYLYRTAMNAFRSWNRRATLRAKRDAAVGSSDAETAPPDA